MKEFYCLFMDLNKQPSCFVFYRHKVNFLNGKWTEVTKSLHEQTADRTAPNDMGSSLQFSSDAALIV